VKLNLRCVPPEQLALMVQTEPAPMWQDCPHACDSYLLTARAHAPHFASQGPRVTRKTEARKDASPLIIALVSCGRRHEEAMGITLLSIAQHAPNATVLLFVDTPPHIMSCIDLPLHVPPPAPRQSIACGPPPGCTDFSLHTPSSPTPCYVHRRRSLSTHPLRSACW
jgi:hypothetical protein